MIPNSPRRRLWFPLLLAVLLWGCEAQDEAPAAGEGPAGAPQAQAPVQGASEGAERPSPQVSPQPTPRLVPRPGLKGPFVEPPLEQKPELIAHVVVGQAARWQELSAAYAKLRAWPKMPIGYPAVDQARGLEGASGNWALVAGKFARRAWAEDLAEALKEDGHQAQVMYRSYLHDRFRPAPHRAGWPKVGRVFAGVVGGEVPVLRAAGSGSAGTGQVLRDGQLVRVLDERWHGGRRWYRLDEGFISARRLLVDGNVFPAPFGRHAVLGLPLGCHQGQCRWDYWLVGPDFAGRRLLKAGGERMPHAFSPDGRWLAYSDFEPRLHLLRCGGVERHDLGPGTSPAWGAGGRSLLYRGPGVKKQRDQVFVVDARPLAEGKAPGPPRVLYDLKGTPYYPKAMSTIPPPVDQVDAGPNLFTLFFRAAEKKGKVEVQRWGVIFTPEGKVIDKKGVKIAD